MAYNVSTNLTFTRIHICHHCGHPFDYKIEKPLSADNVLTEKGGISALQDKANKAVKNDFLKIRCPHCKLYQNTMIYSGMKDYCYLAIVLLVIFWIVIPLFTFAGTNNSGLNFLISYSLYNLVTAVLVVIPVFLIRGYFRVKPETDFFGDGEKTYQATLQYYHSLQRFLLCTLPAVFIPVIGGYLGLVTLFIFFGRIFLMPSYISHPGFPLFSKDVNYHR